MRVEISLRKGVRSLIFMLVVLSASLLLVAETLFVGLVSSFKTPSQGRLIALLGSKDDPEMQNRLGQVYRNIDLVEGIRHLQRATDLSPYSRRYWSDLASACEAAVDTRCEDRAIERLIKLCPMVPLYHWLAARSYLTAGRVDEGVRQFRRLLELDPGYAGDTWICLRSVQDPDIIFQEMLADGVDSEIKVGFVDFLSAQGEDDAAYRIWRLVLANARPFPFSSAKPYIERLLDLGRIEEAESVWQDLARLGVVKSTVEERGNSIFNGDFEHLPLNAGFDWRPGNSKYVSIDFLAPGAYHGDHCLRIDFTVSRNDEYEPVYQIVPVLPNRHYVLEAYIRSEDITSDTGPLLRVKNTDESDPTEAISETTVGTTRWHPVRLDFLTGPRTRSVRFSIWRPRGRAFPTEISGSFWLDAVLLRQVNSPVERGTPDGQH